MSQLGMMPNMMGVDPNLASGAGAPAGQGSPTDYSMGMNMAMFQGMYPGMMNPGQANQTPNNQ